MQERKQGKIGQAFAKSKNTKRHVSKKELEYLSKALLDAVWYENKAGIVRLIRKGADITAKYGEFRETPLQSAAGDGYTSVCALLISECINSGKDIIRFINSKDKDGDTAMKLAAKKGHVQTVDFFKSIKWLAYATGSEFMKSFSKCIA
jgi:ankyrin repeat protein